MEAELPEGWHSKPLYKALMRARASVSQTELAKMPKVQLYSIPAYDDGRAPQSVSGAGIKSNKTRTPEDCILFSKLNPRIPRVWRVQNADENTSVCSTEFWALTPSSDEIFLDFYAYYLKSPHFLLHPSIKPASSTNSHQRVDRKAFDAFELPLPPLPEQHRIAEILTTVDDSIRAGERVIEQAKRVKKGLMEELLTGGLGSAAIERGEVPDGWEGGTATKISEPNGLQTGPFGSQLKSEDYEENAAVHVIMPKDIRDGSITFSTAATITEQRAEPLKKHRLRRGDILFARRGDLSKIAVYLDDTAAICGTGCLRLRPSISDFDAVFLRYMFAMPYAFRWLEANAVGATMLNLNTNIIGNLPVSFPSDVGEQRRIATILTSIDDQIDAERKHVEQQKRLKQGLMDDLLTGRVRTV